MVAHRSSLSSKEDQQTRTRTCIAYLLRAECSRSAFSRSNNAFKAQTKWLVQLITRNELHKGQRRSEDLMKEAPRYCRMQRLADRANDAWIESFGFPASRAASAIGSDDANYVDDASNKSFTPQGRRSLS